jgi:NTE family protein
MLQELITNQGLDFHVIRGVSVGALNAAFLAQASTAGDAHAALVEQVQALQQIWQAEIQGNHSIYADRGGFPALILGADSLYSLKPLRALIEHYLSLEALRASGRDFAVGTVSLVTGRYQEWRPNDPAFLDKLMASASIPVVFPFVDVKDEREVLVDGGVRNITPLSSAFRASPDELYVLLTSRLMRQGQDLPLSAVQENAYSQWDDNWLGTKVSGLDVLQRTLNIVTDEIYLEDIRGALHWNDVATSIMTLDEAVRQAAPVPSTVAQAVHKVVASLQTVNKRPVKISVLAPRQWFGESNAATEFSPRLIREAIEHGREVAADPKLWVWPPSEPDRA